MKQWVRGRKCTEALIAKGEKISKVRERKGLARKQGSRIVSQTGKSSTKQGRKQPQGSQGGAFQSHWQVQVNSPHIKLSLIPLSSFVNCDGKEIFLKIVHLMDTLRNGYFRKQ